ncbi:molybdate ABC transporter permease subunit [Marivibrio halodurans]|uniref:Molybdenum transport system permease n=1 Tax=Marivibrio halodurans TaxID=2039722 RepID=A0A8J7S2A4_9PROT|nr:molybdate ABC transporter permease subunit [Marivibrio halodurans]MBP5855399.1 molybdate ABC transporter permease subunit [Marivibrio halodurans]
MTDWLTPVEWEALGLSAKVAIWSVGLSLPLAVATAYLLTRVDFPGRSVVNGLIHLPLVLPPVVTGYLLLILFGTKGPIGGWLEDTFGIVLAFRWTGAVLAAALMGFPLMVRAIRLSLEGIDPRMESAARTLGAGRAVVFLTISLPQLMPGIIAGAILSFAKGVGEFGATITFVSNIPGETRTLSIAIYSFLQTPTGDAAAIRLTVIAVVLSMAALIASELLARRASRRVKGMEP